MLDYIIECLLYAIANVLMIFRGHPEYIERGFIMVDVFMGLLVVAFVIYNIKKRADRKKAGLGQGTLK